jgi:hypothetical protein
MTLCMQFGLQGLSLSIEQVNLLWSTLVLRAVTDRQRNTAYKWFEELLYNTWAREALTTCEDHLFLNLICKVDPSALGDIGFSLFRFSMKYINWRREFYQESSQQLVKSFNLIGMPTLWDIAVGAEVDSVALHACYFLNDLHQCLSAELQPRIAEKREEYIATCMHHMQQVGFKILLPRISFAYTHTKLRHILQKMVQTWGTTHGWLLLLICPLLTHLSCMCMFLWVSGHSRFQCVSKIQILADIQKEAENMMKLVPCWPAFDRSMVLESEASTVK